MLIAVEYLAPFFYLRLLQVPAGALGFPETQVNLFRLVCTRSPHSPLLVQLSQPRHCWASSGTTFISSASGCLFKHISHLSVPGSPNCSRSFQTESPFYRDQKWRFNCLWEGDTSYVSLRWYLLAGLGVLIYSKEKVLNSLLALLNFSSD